MRPTALFTAASFALAACGAPAGPTIVGEQASQSDRFTGDLPGFFDCARGTGAVISAHRGGAQYDLAENTLEAIEATILAGIFMLEVDVRTTRDGVLVLHHDDELERNTDGQGLLSETDAGDLGKLRLKSKDGHWTDAKIPTLKDALKLAKGRAILQLDIKRGTDIDDIAAVLQEADAARDVVLITYTLDQARVFAGRLPETVISVTIDDIKDLDVLAASGLRPAQLLAWTGIEAPNPALNSQLAAQGVEVIFGTLGPRGSWDDRIAASGNERGYESILAEGVHILATGRPREAAAALTADDAVLAQCTAHQTGIAQP